MHRGAVEEKAKIMIEKLRVMKLTQAIKLIKNNLQETLTYYKFPSTHWRSLRTNNPLERIMREIRRRKRVVGAFPVGYSALMLYAARLRHIAGIQWGIKKYMNMNLLKQHYFDKQAA